MPEPSKNWPESDTGRPELKLVTNVASTGQVLTQQEAGYQIESEKSENLKVCPDFKVL